MPSGTSGSSANACSAREHRLEAPVERDRAAQRRAARSRSASARSAASRAARGRPGAARGTAPRCWRRNGRWTGKSGSPRRAPGARRDRVLDLGARDLGAARRTSCRGCGTARPASRPPGATSAPPGRARGRSRRRPRVGVGEVLATGCRLRSSGRKTPIALLIDSPRPASASPNSSRFVRDAARVSSSNCRELVDLDRRGLGGRTGIVSPSRKPSLRRAPGDLDVLQAERRARPDEDRRVLRQRRRRPSRA